MRLAVSICSRTKYFATSTPDALHESATPLYQEVPAFEVPQFVNQPEFSSPPEFSSQPEFVNQSYDTPAYFAQPYGAAPVQVATQFSAAEVAAAQFAEPLQPG